MGGEEEPISMNKVLVALFIVFFLTLLGLQSIGCLPENKGSYSEPKVDKYEGFVDEEEKLIYELLRANDYSHEESRNGVINSRGVY